MNCSFGPSNVNSGTTQFYNLTFTDANGTWVYNLNDMIFISFPPGAP